MNALLMALAACSGNEDRGQHAVPFDADEGIVYSAASSSFDVGSLGVYSPSRGLHADSLATTSGDPHVFAQEQWVLQVNSFQADNVRIYEAGAWDRPFTELSVEAGSTPHAAALCGDWLWVTRYDAGDLAIYDPVVKLAKTPVDLSEWAGSDGNAEPSSLVRVGGRLFVALQRLDRQKEWSDDGGGFVLEVDCDTHQVEAAHATGPNPSIAPWPGRDDVMLIRTGVIYDDWEPLFDGGLAVFDLETGTVETLFDEELYRRNVHSMAIGEDGRGLAVLTDSSDQAELLCFDATERSSVRGPTSGAFWSDVVVGEPGEGFIAQRPGWIDADAGGQIRSFDLDTCEESADPITPELPPYSMSWMVAP